MTGKWIFFAANLFLLISCSEKSYRQEGGQLVSSSELLGSQSTIIGNFVATAIKETNQLDIVLYPTPLLKPSSLIFLQEGMSEEDIEYVAQLYPDGVKDQFIIGSMNGKALKEFIRARSRESYTAELETAGLEYHISYTGGMETFAYFSKERNIPLVDDQYYRVAISQYFFFSGKTFPSYKYRNGIGFSFQDTMNIVSAKESIRQYLHSQKKFPDLKNIRAKVTKTVVGQAGKKLIREIQGAQHRSPLYGQQVTTSGIVTAVGTIDWYPGGVDLYIQDPNDDGDPRTSEAVHVYLTDVSISIHLGDQVEVTGIVYEQMGESGLGRTSIRELSNFKILSTKNNLPAPVVIGKEGREIPNKVISTFKGNLNLKPDLNLNEGIDFFESLEGMRISYSDPRIVGFRGGQEDFEELTAKGYLTLYTIANGMDDSPEKTPNGGIILNQEENDYNPEILTIITNHLTKGLDPDIAYNVGDQLHGTITGVLGYEKNIFGDGEFAIVLPEAQSIFQSVKKNKDPLEVINRPKTRLVATDDNQLTLATFNVENLAGYQDRRIAELGKAINTNLKCPDILNLVEIQDYNGQDFTGSTSAEQTLQKIIDYSNCGKNNYHAITIDPTRHNEGGQPGGNIRVAMLYNTNKIQFIGRPVPGPREETVIDSEGNLNFNPGRVYPNDPAFEKSRKSMVAQFSYKGKKLFLIGNHLNAKLGDTSLWSAVQPPFFESDIKRTKMAGKLREFIDLLQLRNPDAYIAVLGDFNALYAENSMKVLESSGLRNLVTYQNIVPFKERYTTNHNGNSQAIDYIFVNQQFLNRSPDAQVLHLNTDFMGRISDHDPVISKFQF